MIRGERYPDMTKEYLTQEYQDKGRTCGEIAADWGCSPSAVERRVRKFGLQRSNHQRYGVENFTGSTIGQWQVGEETRKGGSTVRYYVCTCSCPRKTVQLVAGHRLREDSPRPSRMCNECVYRAVGGAKDKGCGEIPGYYWRNLYEGAKNKGAEMLITIEYAWALLRKQEKCCALTGVPIGFGPSKRLKNQTTASLDRIDASGDYTEGNVRWVHKVVNRMRWDLPDWYFVDLCRAVVGHLRGRFGSA
jgi:transposase-like protein